MGQTSLSCLNSAKDIAEAAWLVIPNISNCKEHLTGRVVVFHLLGGVMNLCKVCSMFEYVFADASPTPERTWKKGIIEFGGVFPESAWFFFTISVYGYVFTHFFVIWSIFIYKTSMHISWYIYIHTYKGNYYTYFHYIWYIDSMPMYFFPSLHQNHWESPGCVAC